MIISIGSELTNVEKPDTKQAIEFGQYWAIKAGVGSDQDDLIPQATQRCLLPAGALGTSLAGARFWSAAMYRRFRDWAGFARRRTWRHYKRNCPNGPAITHADAHTKA